MTIRKIDLKFERDRIANSLRKGLFEAMRKAGCCATDIPAPRMLAALNIGPVQVDAADVALILELFNSIDSLHSKGIEADRNFMRHQSRISAAEMAYRDQRVKGSKAKAIAAARALGLEARAKDYWSDRYADYVRLVSVAYERPEAIAIIAEKEGRTNGAMYQGLKREIMRRRASGEQGVITLPRVS